MTVPEVCLRFDDDVLYRGQLPTEKHFEFQTSVLSSGQHRLSLLFDNKDYGEQLNYGKDMAVIVEHVYLENQPTDFKIYSQYDPIYPASYRRDKISQGINLEPTVHSNYLGWNGTWYLDIQVPIFYWIHKTINLGWVI